MIIESRYSGRSGVVNGLTDSSMKFAASTLREATFFEGTLGRPLLFREGLAALYDVVVSDFKYRPRDRMEFKAWLEQQDWKFLASLGTKSKQIRERMEVLESRRTELDALRTERLRPFHRARKAYFDHVYHNQYELMLILDPVITIHPDQIAFEAFSRDESSYARLAAKFELFSQIDSFQCGTTNIDFSPRLHGELERMRTYRRTRFAVSPSGFSVASDDDAGHVEKKIELPDSWLAGFLQVHAVMSMGLTHLRIDPVDLFNICRTLRQQKAKVSPRSIRWELEPGKRARVVLEPWNHVIELTESAVFAGPKPVSIRTWGRDRLRTLSRLIPCTKSVDVYLAGYGMPSFYVLDLGPATFTLALSGWTDNDWTGGTSFEMLMRRLSVTAPQLLQVYESLRGTRFATEDALSKSTGFSVETCRSAVSYLCQAGRAMVDLTSGVLRHRDLFFSPFTINEARAVVDRAIEETNPGAKAARKIVEDDNARIIARRQVATGFKLSGSVRGTKGERVRPLVHLDHEGKILEATCTCPEFKSAKLTKGPCEHMLALRLIHMDRLRAE